MSTRYKEIATVMLVLTLLAGCGKTEPTPTPVPPTATVVPPTPIPPTATAVPPTKTPLVTPSVTPTSAPPTPAPEPSAALISLVDSGQRLGSARSWDVELGDLDGDGDLDAFVANGSRGDESSAVWLNDGQGAFTISEQELGYGMGVGLGDIDGDGDLDAFVMSWDEAGKVWLNDGAGVFADSGQALGDAGGWEVALGDLDSDDDLDVFVASNGANTIWLNDGEGVFTDTGQRLGVTYTAAVGLGDLDGDGDLDALTVGWGEPGKVWLNDGTATFTDSEQTLTPGYEHIHGMALGDVNGDGALDAFMAGDPNQIWLNDGAGTFGGDIQGLPGSAGDTIAFGDLDGDGDLDAYLAVGDWTASDDTVWLNDGGVQGGTPGHFTDSDLPLSTDFSSGIGLGDLDGDGDLDAFVVHGELGQDSGGGIPNEVWLNETIAPMSEAPSPLTGSGEVIAFSSNRDGDYEIYVMAVPGESEADGSGLRQLTDNNIDDWMSSWSPDGTKIAFSSQLEIYIMSADGSDQQRLTDHNAEDGWISWSPDGTQIVFQSDRDGSGDIYVMNVSGTDLRRLTDNPAVDGEPDWSPNGTKITFISYRDGNEEIYVMNADGSDQQRLSDHYADDRHPAWSPDGTKIVFGSGRNGHHEIYVMNADGSDQRRLTDGYDRAWLPDWSPDGTKITFLSNRDGKDEIYIMNADGSELQQLTNDGTGKWEADWRVAASVVPSATSLGDVWTRPSDGMAMVYVPGGEFQMGSSDAEVDAALEMCNTYYSGCARAWFEVEQPAHSVALDGFWIDRTEVTNGQYQRCVEAGACDPPHGTGSDTRSTYYGDSAYDDYPVVNVNWRQADGYCAWTGGRLPTEAEWEYAARGPEGRRFPWGDEYDGTKLNSCDVNCGYGWAEEAFDDGYADTAPVGSYPSGASWCGALDMAGNVYEWMGGWYGEYSAGRQVNPSGPPSGTSHPVRSDAADGTRSVSRSAARHGMAAHRTYQYTGFRCVLPSGEASEELRITTVYDNIAYDSRLKTAWGFAALIEYGDQTLLFDTGGDAPTLLGNMEILEIDPASIQTVVLSHIHGDHTGGLEGLLQTGARPTVYVPPAFPGDFKRRVGAITELVEVAPGQAVAEGMFTTGEMVGDSIHEQALVIPTDGGLVIVTGCAHPGIVEMVRRATELFDGPVRLVMGGFHLRNKSDAQLQAILSDLRQLGVVQVAPSHCTGEGASAAFAAEYGDDYVQAGAGRVIVFGDQVSATISSTPQ